MKIDKSYINDQFIPVIKRLKQSEFKGTLKIWTDTSVCTKCIDISAEQAEKIRLILIETK